ncbi:unnamed protein product [Caenorhabditis auriculariae]|uniref:Uncharacterized protein n=1 Tax=Caenorhabditis auriculariae TaxID=2777116 RepID=A0A8S1HT36_9PELO|nr:unnamed protein product [Caenorhabditis auriculariae]
MASGNPWEIGEAEYANNSRIFQVLTSGSRLMDSNTARNALLKSNLPPAVLAQIWVLSDLDKDGSLDVREYSIAMRLALNCIAGIPLPPQLPPSLLVVPSPMSSANGMGFPQNNGLTQQTPPMMGSYSLPMSAPPQPPMAPQMSQTPERGIFDGRQCENWTIPHSNKLKYCQNFNQLDKQRLGWLSSQAARSALGLTGLSTPALAHIWFLSDVNRDGKLSVDEYCIAMQMIDMFKAGNALPKTTPPELAQMCGVSRSANNTPEIDPNAPPAQKSPALKTFEDKRMDNFAKGQAELERRRQILMEEENRRRAEIEKREREEEARRERERLEKERQWELQRQEELERLRVLEKAREEEERKRQAEREKMREEEEEQRKVAMEKQKLKQLQEWSAVTSE